MTRYMTTVAQGDLPRAFKATTLHHQSRSIRCWLMRSIRTIKSSFCECREQLAASPIEDVLYKLHHLTSYIGICTCDQRCGFFQLFVQHLRTMWSGTPCAGVNIYNTGVCLLASGSRLRPTIMVPRFNESHISDFSRLTATRDAIVSATANVALIV